MDIDQLTDLFMWMTIINMAMFLFSVVLTMLLRRVVCKMHGKMFGIPEEQVAIILYTYFGIYKIGILFFNLVPYVALLIVR